MIWLEDVKHPTTTIYIISIPFEKVLQRTKLSITMVAPSHPVLGSSLGSSSDQQVATIQRTNLENCAAGSKISTGPAQKLIQFFLLRPSAARGGSYLPGQLHAVVWFLPSRAWRSVFLFPTLEASTFSNWAPTLHIELVWTVQVSCMPFLCLSFLYFHLQTSAPALTSLSATLRIIKVRFITNVASADSLALVTAAHVVHCRDPFNRPTCYSDAVRSHRWRCLSKLLLGNP